MKQCRTCWESLPYSEFYSDKSKRTGYAYDCKECKKKKSLDWSKRNPDKKREAWNRYNSRKHGNDVYEILDKDIRKLKASPCIYCGSIENITIDHVIPVTRGGSNGIGNMAPACKSCNSSKNNRTIMEWRTGVKRKTSSNIR